MLIGALPVIMPLSQAAGNTPRAASAASVRTTWLLVGASAMPHKFGDPCAIKDVLSISVHGKEPCKLHEQKTTICPRIC